MSLLIIIYFLNALVYMFVKFIEMRQNAMIKNIPSQVFGYFTLYSIWGFTLEIPLLFIE